MRRLFTLAIAFVASCLAYGLKAQDTATTISNRLISDGFENVRVVQDGNQISVVLEDNHYRGIFRGLGVALQLISPSAEATDTIELIALENRMPRLTVKATHIKGSWNVDTEYGGTMNRKLRRAKSKNSSAYKLDIVPYPSFIFSNHRYDRLWSLAMYISPTLEMDLWPGAKVTAQMKVLAIDNFKDATFDKVLPGYITLSQQIISNSRWDVKATAGLFNLYRNGVDVRGTYHFNNQLDFGLIVGGTGPWYVRNHKLTMCNIDKFNIVGQVNYYEPRTNLQFDLKFGRFVFEDTGVRLDVLRHLRDYAVGIYANKTNTNANIGFEFSVPIGPKKMGKHRALRVRFPETVSLRNSENIGRSSKTAYTDRLEQLYKIGPDDNYSAHYWQPELIKEYLQLFLEGVID